LAWVLGSSGGTSRPAPREEGLDRLQKDLSSGAWHARYGHLLAADTLDLGYRVVVARLDKGRVA
jgi:hypothetical protein